MGRVRTTKSSSPIPTTETANEQTNGAPSTLTDSQWRAAQDILNRAYAYRTPDGHDPSRLFHRKVNKRAIPAYYEIIKEPMALSVIKQKIAQKTYKSFDEYVRDFALIAHNAFVYNRADSGAYQDAVVLKKFVEAEFKKLVGQGLISASTATLPYLGEIPPQDDIPAEEEEEDDDEDDDDDEEDEGEESEEDGKRRRRRGPRSSAAIAKRESGVKVEAEKKEDPGFRKKRGRPPRVDTPMEARCKNILKNLRRFKNSSNQVKVSHFERLPDKAVMPEYYNEIKNPMAMDVLKKKLKRKKYHSFDQFMKDVDLMFENAKLYNEDDSQIYKDAVDLQREARILADEERKKPDSDFVMEDGRIPMPDGILHNGELWKVGDWVHVQNPNDLTKPIVAQIYRTWQDTEGGKFVNVCWYYRPEQTVHRFDKHFFDNEVVKTGQYRDHRVEEIVDRCFVMFFTRYNKGRPRGFPEDKEVYVCEARYNEEKHRLNKIKTWASCLPDEVRDRDYEMDLFPAPKKLKKQPSPIAYLLKEDAKETDELPKPEWGADNAPPKIGAVHTRPRDPKDSPPPEPTPTPPPTPPPPPPKQAPAISAQGNNSYVATQQRDFKITGNAQRAPVASTPTYPNRPLPSYTPQHTQNFLQPTSTAPLAQHSLTPLPRGSQQNTPTIVDIAQAATQHQRYSTTQVPTDTYSRTTSAHPLPPSATASNYKAPQPIEVYTLGDAANMGIPADVRAQFHCDDYGRLLFYTAPPLVDEEHEDHQLSHSARYLAAKAERLERLSKKRAASRPVLAQEEERRKKRKIEELERSRQLATEQSNHALEALVTHLEDGATWAYKAKHDFANADQHDLVLEMRRNLDRLEEMQREESILRGEREKRAQEREEKMTVPLTGLGVFLDDADPRY